MTFIAPAPNQTYHPRVYAAFGYTINDDPSTWVWTDITRYVRPGLMPVTCSGGRPALAGTADPAQITLMLDNTDGRFTARSPLLRNGSANPYWPHVVRNTPLKVALTWDGATAEYEILTAFVNGWPLQPNAGLINVSVPIVASGRLRRLRRSAQTARSALFRKLYFAAFHAGVDYDGYWTMEDLAGATQFAAAPPSTSVIAEHISIPAGSKPVLATNTAVPGSAALPDFSAGARVTARVPLVNSGNSDWFVDHVLFVGNKISGSGSIQLTRAFNSGGSWRVSLDLSGQNWLVDVIDPTGAVTNVNTVSFASTINPFDGNPHMVRLNLSNVGIAWSSNLIVDGEVVAGGGSTLTSTGSVVTKVGVAGDATGFPLVIGHLAVWNRALVADSTDAMLGYAGESAGSRIIRLCQQEGIPLTTLQGVGSAAMGPQPVDTVANLLDATADIDNGLLHDAGANGSLVYAYGSYRYNRPISMTLDYTRHQIGDGLVATYDDQDLATEWTVNRANGSSANDRSDTPPDGYALEDTVNAATDDQLMDIASWRTHLGTYDAYRLPLISINMRTTPELAQAATSAVLPFRISPTSLPVPYPQESLDQFAEAFITTIDSVIWETDYTCTPYGPWQVATYAGPGESSVPASMLVGASYNSASQWATDEPASGPWKVARVYSSTNFAANWSSDVAAHAVLSGLAICISWKPDATELSAIGAGSRDSSITAYLRTIPTDIPVFVEIWHEADVKNHQGTLPTTIAILNAAKQRFYTLAKAVQAEDHPLLYTCLILSQFRLQAGDNENTWWVGGDGSSRIIDVVGFDTYLLNNTLGTGASFQSASVAFCDSHGAGYAMPEIGINGATNFTTAATWMQNQADYAAVSGPVVNNHVCCFLAWFDSTTGGGTATPSGDPAMVSEAATLSVTYETDPGTWVMGGTAGTSAGAGSIYDSASSTVNTAISATGTTLSVAVADPGDVWTTSAGSFPFMIKVDLEVMTVTNVTGSSSPQSMTVTRGTSGVRTTHAVGAEVHAFPLPIYAL